MLTSSWHIFSGKNRTHVKRICRYGDIFSSLVYYSASCVRVKTPRGLNVAEQVFGGSEWELMYNFNDVIRTFIFVSSFCSTLSGSDSRRRITGSPPPARTVLRYKDNVAALISVGRKRILSWNIFGCFFFFFLSCRVWP